MIINKSCKAWYSCPTAVYLEHYQNKLLPHVHSVVAAAKQVSKDKPIYGVLALDLGPSSTDPAQHPVVREACDKLSGLSKLIVANHASFAHGLPETIAPLLVHLQQNELGKEGVGCWMTGHSSIGKNIFPRFAAICPEACAIPDITGIIDADTFERPIYAGNAITKIQTKSPLKVITVRTTAFQSSNMIDNKSKATVPVTTVAYEPGEKDLSLGRWIEDESTKTERPDLGSAEIVVSGGRALKSVEKFRLIFDLADVMGGAVGASRAAVDAGYVPNELQVGQTGKIVAPKLYFAIGISGAIQHVAGMKDAKFIVAINKDKEAPIFQIANYGLVGDLFTIVPELISKWPQKRLKANAA